MCSDGCVHRIAVLSRRVVNIEEYIRFCSASDRPGNMASEATELVDHAYCGLQHMWQRWGTQKYFGTLEPSLWIEIF